MDEKLKKEGLIKIYIPVVIVNVINKWILENYSVKDFQSLSNKIIKINEFEYKKISQKVNRIFDKSICQLINNWLINSIEINNILGSESNRISPLSEYELNIRDDLKPFHLDIFFRIVRKDKKDIGPPHYDELIWGQGKNTSAEVSVKNKEKRWKLWIPLEGSDKENALQFVRGSHLEDIPWFYDTKRVTQTTIATGAKGSPAIEKKWLAKNEKNFIPEVWNLGEAVIFHDKIVHKGPINKTNLLRTSAEFTILSTPK